MKRKLLGNLNVWQFEKFSDEPGINHFVTDRHSVTDKTDFTLSYSSSPDHTEIENNRNLLAHALAIPDRKLYLPNQIHQTTILNVKHTTVAKELVGTDALITNQKGVCIAVLAADCVSILLYDRTNNAVGAVHSGWRGTVARILYKTLHEMNKQFGTTGKDLVAGIGPSVCQDSYEVGGEVIAAINDTFGHASGLLIPQANDKAKLDLWKANTLQLLEYGVELSNIEISNLCTVKNNTNFFSARKGDVGRFATGIMLI